MADYPRRDFIQSMATGLMLPVGSGLMTPGAAANWLLIPMDDRQINHLKAYGVTFRTLTGGGTAEWLLNYRGGEFPHPGQSSHRTRCSLGGCLS